MYLKQSSKWIMSHHEFCLFQTQLGRFRFFVGRGKMYPWRMFNMPRYRDVLFPPNFHETNQENENTEIAKKPSSTLTKKRYPRALSCKKTRFILDTFDMTKLSTKKQAIVLPPKAASKLLWCCPSNSGFPEFESIAMFIENCFAPGEMHACALPLLSVIPVAKSIDTSQVDFWSWNSFKSSQLLFFAWGFLFVNTSPIPLLTLSLWYYDDMTWYDIAASFFTGSNTFFIILTKTFQGAGERSYKTQATKSIPKNGQVANLKDATSESKRHSETYNFLSAWFMLLGDVHALILLWYSISTYFTNLKMTQSGDFPIFGSFWDDVIWRFAILQISLRAQNNSTTHVN